MPFKLTSPFKPTGDQPQAVKKLTQGIKADLKHQTLLGVTGSGKTFSIANVIEKTQMPTLVISHNKTLAAQLTSEFKEFFPNNAVHYFVSYYDYYQPEAYLPSSDTYIEKETQINEEIERLRLLASESLLTRDDVIIVASVSCIYGLGSPDDFQNMSLSLEAGQKISRDKVLKSLIEMQYKRNNIDFYRGTVRARGDTLDIFPAYELNEAVRIEWFGDEIEKIKILDAKDGVGTFRPFCKKGEMSRPQLNSFTIYPARHYLAPPDKIKTVLQKIKSDLKNEIKELKKQNKLLEAQRLEQRTKYDLEMIKETGFCNGIENYSRYFEDRRIGKPPFTLIDYFQYKNKPFLTIIDESHMTIPQIRGMYAGDRSRKQTLVSFGFRMKSALDNRPLDFSEFNKKIEQVVYVSATPAEYELSKHNIVEQLIRPTGLLDPKIDIRPTQGQIKNLVSEVKKRIKKKQRVLITTLTKHLAEELDDYLKELNIKSQYLHSDINTLERLDILRDLRLGKYDVLVGINLLREGLDLPEVSLVAILDADKEGFLRSTTSLIQVMGRAARHKQGYVIMYADQITKSIKQAIDETKRRRRIQEAYNKKYNITPKSIKKRVLTDLVPKKKTTVETGLDLSLQKKEHLVKELKAQMEIAAENLQFEKATELRDLIEKLK